jgi:hypothetical protein
MVKNVQGLSAHWKRMHANREETNLATSSIVVFPDQKVIYLKFPKNGGTSLLRHWIGQNYSGRVYHYGDTPDEFDKWLEDITDEELQEYFIYTISRNPYDRFISQYVYIYGDNDVKKTCTHAKLDNEPDPIRRHHFMSQSELCLTADMFDYIGKMESFEESLEVLSKQLSCILEDVPNTNKSSRTKSDYSDYFDDNLLRLVNERYKRDFEMFRYTMELQ